MNCHVIIANNVNPLGYLEICLTTQIYFLSPSKKQKKKNVLFNISVNKFTHKFALTGRFQFLMTKIEILVYQPIMWY